MDRGPWWAKVHGVTKSQTQLSTAQQWNLNKFGSGGLVTESYPTLANPRYSPPDSSVYGISQAILEWVAISFSRAKEAYQTCKESGSYDL